MKHLSHVSSRGQNQFVFLEVLIQYLSILRERTDLSSLEEWSVETYEYLEVEPGLSQSLFEVEMLNEVKPRFKNQYLEL